MKFNKENAIVCVAGLVVLGAVFGSYAAGNYMGVQEGLNKILSEQEAANETAHTDWADFGGGYYIIGAEIIEGTETGALFKLINGETYYVEKEGLNIDSVYYLTMDNNGTSDYYQDDEVVVIWEAK